MENSKKIKSSLQNVEKLLKSQLKSVKGGKGAVAGPPPDEDCSQCKVACSPGGQ